jgi:hypothetical protein
MRVALQFKPRADKSKLFDFRHTRRTRRLEVRTRYAPRPSTGARRFSFCVD